MLTLFRGQGDSPDLVIPHQWNSIQQLMMMNDGFRRKWFNSSVGTDNDNILVSLILSFDVDYSGDYYKFARKVNRSQDRLASHFKFVHFGNRGEPVDNLFKDTRVVVAKVEHGLPDTSEWETMSPLVVVETTEDETRPFDMTQDQVSSDMVFCELDILALMSMYRSYVLHMNGKNFAPNVGQFVRNYVIANAFPSYQSIAILNMYLQTAPTELIERDFIPITFTRPDRNINAMIRKNRDEMFDKLIPFDHYLRSIPTLDGNALNTMRIFHEGNGFNNLTFEYVARIRVVSTIMMYIPLQAAVGTNGHIVNSVWYLHKMLDKNNYLRNCTYREVSHMEYEEFIIKLKE